MTYRQLPFFTLSSLALLVAAIGCRDSAKKAQPAASPTPVAQTQKSAAAPIAKAAGPAIPKREPDLAEVVPLRTFQVKPPASFTSDQFPEDGAVEFLVPATAGQILHIILSEEWEPYALVQPLGDRSQRLIPGGDNSGNRLYALQQTGTYRIVARHANRESPETGKASIRFALLTIDDPLVDPGVRPEQIAIDFGPFAQKEQLAVVPYSDFEGDIDDFWPSHLGVENHGLGNGHFEFRIMRIAGYKKIFQRDASMDLLEAALQNRGKDASATALPYPSYGDAGLNFATHPQFLEGEGWRGLRWIASYGQDIGCWFDDFSYVFEGISNDGQLFLLMRSTISNPKVASRIAQDCNTAVEERPRRDRDMDQMFKKDVPAMFDKAITGADPASFQPNLNQLDAVIRSLKLR